MWLLDLSSTIRTSTSPSVRPILKLCRIVSYLHLGGVADPNAEAYMKVICSE